LRYSAGFSETPAGLSPSQIIESYSIGTVESSQDQSEFQNVGGFNGYTNSIVLNNTYTHCYVRVIVNSENVTQNIGGFVGNARGINGIDVIEISYTVPSIDITVQAEDSDTLQQNIGCFGGILDPFGFHQLSFDFYDQDVCGNYNGIGNGTVDSGDSPELEGLSTQQMQGADAEDSMSNFDFENVWISILYDNYENRN